MHVSFDGGALEPLRDGIGENLDPRVVDQQLDIAARRDGCGDLVCARDIELDRRDAGEGDGRGIVRGG